MLYVIAYDISNDRLRGRVADILEGFGHRVQYSVFECRLDAPSLEQLTLRLQGLLATGEAASLRFYRLCEPCERASYAFGDIQPTDSGASLWL